MNLSSRVRRSPSHLRRRTVIVPAIALAAVALAACASPSNSAGSNPTTLTIWTYVDTASPWIAQLETDFKADHPDVTFKYLQVGFNDLTNKIISAAATGTGPDAIVFDPATSASLVGAGALYNFSSEWQGFDDRSKSPEFAVWDVKGGTYAVQAYVNTTALYYNKDLLTASGVTKPPTTFDELKDDLGAVVAAGHKGIAQCGAPTSECETQAVAWILGSGGNYNNFTSSEVKGVFQNWYDLGNAGALGADSVTWAQDDAWSAFTKGDYAFTQNGNWRLTQAAKLPFAWGVVPLPGATVAPGGEGEAIGAFGNKKLAWEYLRSTWFSMKGQLQIFEGTGSVPVRADAQADKSVSADPNVAAWTAELGHAGVRSPFSDPSEYLRATTEVGEVWSALRQGRTTPDKASEQLASSLKGVFSNS